MRSWRLPRFSPGSAFVEGRDRTTQSLERSLAPSVQERCEIPIREKNPSPRLGRPSQGLIILGTRGQSRNCRGRFPSHIEGNILIGECLEGCLRYVMFARPKYPPRKATNQEREGSLLRLPVIERDG